MSNYLFPALLLSLSLCFLSEFSAAAEIARESFQTTPGGAGGTYEDATNFDTATNRSITVGNFGFSSGGAQDWDSNTGTIEPDDDAPLAGAGLTHALVDGEINGAALLQRHFTRNAERALTSTPPASSSYFMSGIVRAGDLGDDGAFFSMGLFDGPIGNNTTDIGEGLHLGMFRDDAISAGELRLGAFAGGTQFDLGAAMLDTNYLIVLELTADSGGVDALSAYVAADGDALAQVLTDSPIETFAGVGDLEYFLLQQTDANGGSNAALEAWADEFRFGTDISDVTNFNFGGNEVPEPTSIALWSLFGLGLGGFGYYRTRRKKK